MEWEKYLQEKNTIKNHSIPEIINHEHFHRLENELREKLLLLTQEESRNWGRLDKAIIENAKITLSKFKTHQLKPRINIEIIGECEKCSNTMKILYHSK